MDELDKQLNELLMDEHPPSPSIISVSGDQRVEVLERRVEALERALEGALDAFQSLATERIREAALAAAHAVQAHLDPGAGDRGAPGSR